MLCYVTIGREITPNCGFDDDGGRHDSPNTVCKANTFNGGSEAYCQPCSSCPPGYHVVSPCNLTTDTQCRDSRWGTHWGWGGKAAAADLSVKKATFCCTWLDHCSSGCTGKMWCFLPIFHRNPRTEVSVTVSKTAPYCYNGVLNWDLNFSFSSEKQHPEMLWNNHVMKLLFVCIWLHWWAQENPQNVPLVMI